jgi:hypothetical protein
MLCKIDESAPDAKVKEITPVIIMIMQSIFSSQVFMLISPYPTVVIVVIVK